MHPADYFRHLMRDWLYIFIILIHNWKHCLYIDPELTDAILKFINHTFKTTSLLRRLCLGNGLYDIKDIFPGADIKETDSVTTVSYALPDITKMREKYNQLLDDSYITYFGHPCDDQGIAIDNKMLAEFQKNKGSELPSSLKLLSDGWYWL